ncbi:MAG: hypothetical protein BWY84_01056 [Candidatus Aerophobetes bacterium ADurb.Bin490]|nr:MAG: hypothetical protein BWY84_01056 [Candidatus Aerophobetes bacterium ADurb.Bin490]
MDSSNSSFFSVIFSPVSPIILYDSRLSFAAIFRFSADLNFSPMSSRPATGSFTPACSFALSKAFTPSPYANSVFSASLASFFSIALSLASESCPDVFLAPPVVIPSTDTASIIIFPPGSCEVIRSKSAFFASKRLIIGLFLSATAIPSRITLPLSA